MRYKLITSILCAMMIPNLMAQIESKDSIKARELNEVVVEAQMQRTSAAVSTYYPDRTSKRAAQNAIDLLNQMAIPQINVNPVDGTVKTPSGDDVAIYIDMELATSEEKDALRPEDVKKVEYMMTSYSADRRQFVSVTASYTFGFGKKIKRGDEGSTSGEGSSAIMK